jgi:hypothetical protein
MFAGAYAQLARRRAGNIVTVAMDAFRPADRRGMYAAIRWLSLSRPDLTPVLDRIDTPRLLTTGTSDPMWTTTNAHAAAAHLTRGATTPTSRPPTA